MESKIRLPQLKDFHQKQSPSGIPPLNLQVGDENQSRNTCLDSGTESKSTVYKTIELYNHMKNQLESEGTHSDSTMVSQDSDRIELKIDLAKHFHDVKSLWDPSGPLTYRNGGRSQTVLVDLPFTCSSLMNPTSTPFEPTEEAASIFTCEALICCPSNPVSTTYHQIEYEHCEIDFDETCQISQAINDLEAGSEFSVHGGSAYSLASSRPQDATQGEGEDDKLEGIMQLLGELGLHVILLSEGRDLSLVQDVIPNFELRKIGLREVVAMSDMDLKMLGIDKLGTRAKLRQRAQLLAGCTSKEAVGTIESPRLYESSSSCISSLLEVDEMKTSSEMINRRQSYEMLDAIDHDLQVEQLENHPLNNFKSLIIDVETKWKQALERQHQASMEVKIYERQLRNPTLLLLANSLQADYYLNELS
eukprot:762750-Hanusia_phi.AAC.2